MDTFVFHLALWKPQTPVGLRGVIRNPSPFRCSAMGGSPRFTRFTPPFDLRSESMAERARFTVHLHDVVSTCINYIIFIHLLYRTSHL